MYVESGFICHATREPRQADCEPAALDSKKYFALWSHLVRATLGQWMSSLAAEVHALPPFATEGRPPTQPQAAANAIRELNLPCWLQLIDNTPIGERGLAIFIAWNAVQLAAFANDYSLARSLIQAYDNHTNQHRDGTGVPVTSERTKHFVRELRADEDPHIQRMLADNDTHRFLHHLDPEDSGKPSGPVPFAA